jgi:hypothetical protein
MPPGEFYTLPNAQAEDGGLPKGVAVLTLSTMWQPWLIIE